MSVENGHNEDNMDICKCTQTAVTDRCSEPDGVVRVGTRGSKLALAQTRLVIEALQSRYSNMDFQMVTMSTRGDRDTSRALLEFGGKAVFVDEFEEAIRIGSIDVAVHSAKDMPMEIMDGLTIAGTLPRACPQDVLIYRKGKTFARDDSFVVGTSSLRRQCQIREMYPRSECRNLRGNVGTRIQKLMDGEYDAIILAAAGLERLGIIERANDKARAKSNSILETGRTYCFEINKQDLMFRYLSTDTMLPAACQGIIAIETRNSGEAYEMVRSINDTTAYSQLLYERAVLKKLNAGCHEPIGVYSELDGNHMKLSLMRADGATPVKEKDAEIQIYRRTVEGNTADWEQLVEALIK